MTFQNFPPGLCEAWRLRPREKTCKVERFGSRVQGLGFRRSVAAAPHSLIKLAECWFSRVRMQLPPASMCMPCGVRGRGSSAISSLAGELMTPFALNSNVLKFCKKMRAHAGERMLRMTPFALRPIKSSIDNVDMTIGHLA